MRVTTGDRELEVLRSGGEVIVRVLRTDQAQHAERIYITPSQAMIAAAALKELANDARKHAKR